MTTPFEGPDQKITGARATISEMGPSGHVLLVDDDLDVLRVNAEVLINAGYNINTARDGAEAWKALQNFNYDLLITDHKMPKMTGVELIQKIRSGEMALPVILVSGAMPTEELERHPGLQIAALLDKPFTGDELLNAVTEVFNAAERIVNRAKLFRDCALLDDGVTKNAVGAPVRERLSLAYRILVVDDDEIIRQHSVSVLADSGYEVESVGDGAAGWEALQNDGYDLVITDNKMPNMTGIEMIARLRASAIPVPVIMATGNYPTSIIQQDPGLKPDGILQRPFSKEELLETVRKVLQTHNGGIGR